MYKPHHQAVYLLHDERDGRSRPAAGAGTSKEYANLNYQVRVLSNKVENFLTILYYEPSGNEDGYKKKKANFGGSK